MSLSITCEPLLACNHPLQTGTPGSIGREPLGVAQATDGGVFLPHLQLAYTVGQTACQSEGTSAPIAIVLHITCRTAPAAVHVELQTHIDIGQEVNTCGAE